MTQTLTKTTTTRPLTLIPDPALVVVRAQEGDPEAFERLVGLYKGRLFRLALTMLSDRQEAEDAVQDVFLQVWMRLPTLEEPRAFSSWVHRLARRRCLDILRTRTRRRTDLTADGELEEQVHHHAAGQRGPEDLVQRSVELRSLERLLITLAEEQRTSWVLKEVHGLSYPEIATAVGAPVSTVRGRLARARRHLATGMKTWR